MKKLVFFFVGSIFLFGCRPQAQSKFSINKDENSLLWRVSGNGLKKPSFLFGTFHLLCRQDLHYSDQLKTAVKYADEIYMEMKMDDPSVLLGGLLFMNMKGDTTLQDLVNPKDYKKISSYFTDSLQMPVELLRRIKPYFLVAMLYPKMMDCATPSGVEEGLLEIAKAEKKEIKGLETIQFQSAIFDSIPYQWQAKELLKSIDSFYLYKKEFQKTLALYKSGNLDSMSNSIATDESGIGKFDDLLLTKRNQNWVTILKDVMKNKSVFVAVGAGHLGGPNGVINLLRKQGYKVQPLIN